MEKKTIKIATVIVAATGIVAIGTFIAGKETIKGFVKGLKKATDIAQDIINEENNTQVIYQIKENEEGNQTLEIQDKDWYDYKSRYIINLSFRNDE